MEKSRNGPMVLNVTILFPLLIILLVSYYIMMTIIAGIFMYIANGIVPPGIKPLPEPSLTKVHIAPLGHNELITKNR